MSKKSKNLKLTKGAGRPTKFLPVFCDQVEKLCKLGATDIEIGEFFNIAQSTLNLWKKGYPQFSEAIKRGKIIADGEVAEKLYKRATGYSHPEDKIFNHEGAPLVVPTTKHYPPDTVAAIFWLKNRQRDKWRDKIDQDITTNGESINQPMTDAQVDKLIRSLRETKAA
jgi:hypothetical protein